MNYVVWALVIYIGGFATLWAPEQIFCGNRLHVSHDSVLQVRNPISVPRHL